MEPPNPYQPPGLRGRVALVAGATHGVRRGIALALTPGFGGPIDRMFADWP